MDYIFLSDIHGNFEALQHLTKLPEYTDETVQFRFGGDYSDGFDLQPDAIKNTWAFIKNMTDNGRAIAILGNHDEFIVDAAFNPLKYTYWSANGQDATLENLGIQNVFPITLSRNLYGWKPSEIREFLISEYYDEINWLSQLPLVCQDGNNILVHAGFDLDTSIVDQPRTTLLWTRQPYINAEQNLRMEDIHVDYNGKTIISGHTPTQLLDNNGRILHKPELVNRYFIDGGSKGGRQISGRINLLKLDANGNEIWRKYLTRDGIFDGE